MKDTIEVPRDLLIEIYDLLNQGSYIAEDKHYNSIDVDVNNSDIEVMEEIPIRLKKDIINLL